MSIRSNSQTGYINNQRDSLNRVIHELRNIIRALSSGGSGSTPAYETGAGVVTPDTLRVTLETRQEAILSDIETILANFDKDAGAVTADTLRVVPDDDTFNLLRDTLQRLNTYSRDVGASTVDTLRVTLEDLSRNNLVDILSRMTTNNTYISYENWDKIPGNSKEFTWINGTLPNNRIVSTIVYKTGLTTIITQTFTYNGNDEVTAITAS